jgi:hypothetical protein
VLLDDRDMRTDRRVVRDDFAQRRQMDSSGLREQDRPGNCASTFLRFIQHVVVMVGSW